MSKQQRRREIQHELDEESRLTEDDLDLLRHVFEDDARPPQGLHQQGHNKRTRRTEISTQGDDLDVEEYLYGPRDTWDV